MCRDLPATARTPGRRQVCPLRWPAGPIVGLTTSANQVSSALPQAAPRRLMAPRAGSAIAIPGWYHRLMAMTLRRSPGDEPALALLAAD